LLQLFTASTPSELEQLRSEKRPALEEMAGSTSRRIGPLDPLPVTPWWLCKLRTGDERVDGF
jgi:hypothetical protein